MKTTMKKLTFAALAALACAIVPSSAAAATGDPCTLRVFLEPGLEAGYVSAAPAQAGQHTAGQTVTLTATATNDFSFVEWVNYNTNEAHNESSFSFVITNDVEWTAIFKKNGEYFIYVSKPWPGLTATPNLYSYATGTNVTLSAPAISGRSIVYEIARDVEGAQQSSDYNWQRLSGNVFTMPAYDIWVRALYSINITASGDEHGTVALSPAAGPYYEGDTISLTMTPDSGYRAKTLAGVPSGTVVSGNTATFTLGDLDDLDIHVEFEKIPTHTLHASVYPPDSGTVAVTYDVTAGNYVATATPTNGYHFIGWINLDDSSFLGTDNPYPLHVTGDMSIRAVFCVNVVVNPNVEDGSLEVVNSRQTYVAGDIVTLLGHPDEGYVVDYYAAGEIHNGSATLQRLEGDSFVMPPWDMLVSVVFVQGLTVSAAASTEGTGTVLGTGTYKPGSTVTLVAEPAEGYTFTGWEEDGTVVSTERIYSFTIQTNRNLTANFQSYNGMSFTINADAVPIGGGTITGTGTYAGGQTVTLTAVPATGCSFLGWSEYGQTIGTQAVYSFTANGNRTLTATFQSTAGITYVNTAGNAQLCENFTTISSAMTTMNTGWYAVVGNVTIANRIEISGAVNLILCDGASLTVPKGIHLTGANSLTIWGQNAGTGALVIESPNIYQAGIGGNARQPCGVFTMNGGTLTATGGEYGAGIGGGGDNRDTAETLSNSDSAGAITISGGTITATGGVYGAGIGGGMQSGTGDITINGGTVAATGGGGGGSGIGGGWFGGDGTVTINGGTITATAGQTCWQCKNCGAGIGGGNGRYLRSVVISGGDVTAVGGCGSAGIGGGSSYHVFCELRDGVTLEELESLGTAYVPGAVTISGGTISATGGEHASGIGGGDFASGGTVTISGGRVTANGGLYGAGIGGGWKGGGGTVAIRDGEVTATGSKYAAGIGAGYEASGGTVEIGGGTVAANGGNYAAGIGGGSNTLFEDSTNCGGGTVVITGGTVTATGGQLEYIWSDKYGVMVDYGAGAGIGGGCRGSGADVTISGGTVIATPGDSGSDDTIPQAIGRGSEGIGDGALVLTLPADGSCLRAGIYYYSNDIRWYPGNLAYPCRQGLFSAIVESGVPHEYDARGHCARCGDSNGPVLPSTPYVDAQGVAQGEAFFLPLTASSTLWHVSGSHGGWYAVTNDLAIPSRVTVSGDVKLILRDGATLTIPRGIEVAEGNSLTILRQAGATGVLLAGGDCAAGDAAIGGDSGENAGNITVNGGNITVVAGAGAQAIGHGAGATGAGNLHFLHMRVFDGVAATEPVGHAQREAVCRGCWARLADCLEHDHVYGTCPYCGFSSAIGYYDPVGRHLQTTTDYVDYLGQTALGDGWYVLFDDVETIGRVAVTGDVNLVLCDGATWNARAGVNVVSGGSLTIWAQSDGGTRGALVAVGGDGQAGVGGGVGEAGGAVMVNGGSIAATGGVGGAGIGGGVGEAGGAVTVNGGSIAATGGVGGAGIGGGTNGAGGEFTFCSGTVTAVAGTGAQAIGHGAGGEGEGGLIFSHAQIHNDVSAAAPVAAADRENACRGAWVRLEPCTEHALQNSFCRYCGMPANNLYQDTTSANAPYLSCEDYTIYSGQLALTRGWYVVNSISRVEGRIEVSGDVNLILCDGSELSATHGIHVVQGNSLTVWAQSQDVYAMGALIATGAEAGEAGIGGNPSWTENGPGGTVTINGGKVTAVGAANAAGIGGGRYDGGGCITINGGSVIANGGYGSAGIGGGDNAGGTVTINGGSVTASGGDGGAGIGGGRVADGSTVTISGGAVVATGGYRSAGIGGGREADGGTVTISGGAVTANGGEQAAGIGGGVSGTGGTITISGGTVAAIGGNRGQAIGGGCWTSDNGNLGIASGYRVGLMNGSGTVVEWASYYARVDICRNAGSAVLVERCESHVDENHDGFCDSCGAFMEGSSGLIYLDPVNGSQLVRRDCQPYAGEMVLGTGWYAVTRSGQIDARLEISGDVNLILCDGAELTVNGGVHVSGSSLTIWAQSDDADTCGALTAVATDSTCAGIGGNEQEGAGTITINGGKVTARNCLDSTDEFLPDITGGAGIGGGFGGDGGTVAIRGGVVTVTSCSRFPAIGGIGGNHDGSLDVSGMRVGTVNGSDVSWVNYTHRVSTCRSANTTVRIERCGPHEDDDSFVFCDMCGAFGLDYESGRVNYRDPADGNRLVQADCSLYAGQSAMVSGWYAVTESWQFNGRLSIFGDVNLILCDGAELTATGGVHVAAGNSLTIWTQSADKRSAGRLTVTGPATGNAGIGADAGENGGAVTIHGGTITVVGGENAQAIGRGSGNGDSGSLILYAECQVGLLNGAGNEWEWTAYGSRTDACRDASGAEVRIERCESHVDGDSDYRCDHCGIFVRDVIDVPYLDSASGNQLVITNCPIYTGAQTLNSGWYAITGGMTVESRIEINGDVNLILCDGAELTASAGIHVIGENRFTVWAQSEDGMTCGRLTVTGAGKYQAGIGGNVQENAGEVTIHGGMVTVCGGEYGAGIGGGQDGLGGMVTISGGTAVVTGGNLSAGIGGGEFAAGGTVTISGGTVVANGSYYGAGIGGGYKGGGCTVTISGGTVTAVGGANAQAFGAGYNSDNSGILVIDGIRVGTVDGGNAVTWVTRENRISICRNRSKTKVRLEPCAVHEFVGGICICCGTSLPLDQILEGSGSTNDPYLIASGDDWDLLANYLSFGYDTDGLHFRQTADLSVTNTLGAEGSPFKGLYDGGGHTLTVSYDDTSRRFLAPFPEISGATISSLRVAGMVSGRIHCSGLVGRAVGGPNTIRDCAVNASVSATDGYAGGFLGHGMSYQTTIEGCVFAGSVSGVNVGTFWGWSDNAVAVLANCLDLSDSGFPVGLGGGTVSMTRVGYVNPDKTEGSAGAWSADKRGVLVHSVMPGADVRLALSGAVQRYDTAGLVACGDAFLVNGILYAEAGRTVSLTLEYVGSNEFEIFSASAGTLSGSTGRYTLTMPDPGQNVTILARCKLTYYDPVRGTNVQIPDGAQVYVEGQTSLSGGWHFVTNSVTTSDRIIVTGDANVVLYDGVELNAMSGITVAEGARLTIWGQEGEHAVPGTAVTTRGTGTLFAQTPASGDYRQAAAIGGENGGSTGDIVINGGVVTARGVWGAGIGRGNIASGAVGSVTINGGSVDASGSSGSAGIGSGAYADSCPVMISGGYVVAIGCVYDATGQATPGIGTGRPRIDGSQPLSNGTITIIGGTVVAQAGEAPSGGTAAQAIGVNAADAANNGTGHLVLGDVRAYASADAVSPVAVSARGDTCRGTYVKVEACARHQDGNADTYCDYCGGYCGPVPPIDANGVFLIGSTDDWNVFAASVAAGKRYDGETVRLTANIAVTTTVGTSDHPFGGIFDGCGHTLTVAIDSSEQTVAPFGKIDGATIKNLTVAGTVTSSAYHAAGLVGGCGNDHPNTILNCTVAATVNGSGYAGGIVGHGGEGALTLDGCVFSGAVSGFDTCAGGLLGWCDALTLTITNCLCTGAFTPAGEGKYHPIACRYASRTVTATVADAYYLNTIVPTVLGVNPTVATSNLIPGAEGMPVSATLVAGEWAQPVTAADGNEYYGWTTAPAGRLIASYTFDDAGNGGINLLRASVGLDAIVRATPTTPVAGIGNITAVTDAAILSGLSVGDGAVSIPNGQHLAVPVPAALLSAHGRPYTVVMKIRVPDTVGWRCLLNMPASNDTDAMVYLQQNTRNIYLKQFSKASNSGIAASNGNVAADQWTTLAFAFGENATDVYLDGTRVLHTTGALANSYADCASAGGYILVGADDSGDDDLFYLSDFRIYEGAVAVAGILPGSGTPDAPYLISSTDDWNAFAANVNAGATSAACYRLGADIAITTTVGTSDHPFGGTFDGGGHTLTASLSGTDSFVAPFSAIGGATISNLVVAGTVAGNMHCSGLVGAIVNGVNVIENCGVAAAITSSGSHFGGFIGHSITSTVTLRGCVFSGSLAGGTYVATFHGWSDDGAATTLIDCLDVSESTQPIGRGTDAVCVSNTYYLASKSFTNGERLWSEGKRGKRASVVTVSEGVTLALGAPTATYGTSGVTAYATGLEFDGNFYTVSGYVIWAAANGTTGAWNATDASGVHNVFRYLFDKPSGAFENPPLLSISFDASGRAVIHTPPINPSATGFDISILATDDLAGTGATTYPLGSSGETTIPVSDKPARFFRLRVTER